MKIVIIGGDAAGMSAASQLGRNRPEWDLTVLEQGEDTSYGACGIPYVFSGDIADPEKLVVVTPQQFRDKRGINVRTGCRVTRLDPQQQTVAFVSRAGTESLPFDRLLIATGARPLMPSWPGSDLPGIFAIRTLQSARDLLAWMHPGVHSVVLVGAGYIGLEMAEAFIARGQKVTLLEKGERPLLNGDPELAARLSTELRNQGVDLHTGVTVSGFTGTDRVHQVETDQGQFRADMVIVCLGVLPNSELAAAAGLVVGAGGAIVVDNRQQTSHPAVWAAGDCATTRHRLTDKDVWIPLALTANRAGRIAGMNMGALAGEPDATFPGTLGTNVVKVFQIYAGSTGLTEEQARVAGFDPVAVAGEAPEKAHYYPGHGRMWIKLIWNRPDGRLLGAHLAGSDASAGARLDVLATALSAALTVQQIAELDLAYAPPFAPVWDPILQVANKAVRPG